MDPNATLEHLRDLTNSVFYRAPTGTEDVRALELAEAFDDLDNWLSRGGFQPDAWDGSRIAGERFYA